MNPILSRIIDDDVKHTPKVSPIMKAGISTHQISKGIDILSANIRNALKGAPEELTFEGIRVLRPEETFNILFSPTKESSTQYDLSKSNLVLCDLGLKWSGETLNSLVYLPYLEPGGLITLSDNKYIVSGVITDSVFSVNRDSILVKVLGGKELIYSVGFVINVNGERKHINIPHGPTLIDSDKTVNTKTLAVPLILYYLISKGIKACKGLVIREQEDTSLNKTHDVYTVSELSSRSVKVSSGWDSPIPREQLHIYVHKTKGTEESRRVAEALIYVYNHETVLFRGIEEAIKDKVTEHELWKYILGTATYRSNKSAGDIRILVENHLTAKRNALDEYSKDKLKHIGVIVNDYFETLSYVAMNYTDMLGREKEINEDPKLKYMETPYYLLFPIILGINKFIIDVTNKYKKASTPLLKKAVEDSYKNNLTRRRIFDIVTGSAINLSLTLLDSSNDNQYLKVGSVMTLQSQGSGVKKAKKKNMSHELKTVNGYNLILGSMLFLNKKTPSPLMRANLFLDICPDTGRIVIDPELEDKAKAINRLLNAHTESMDIELSEIEEVKI